MNLNSKNLIDGRPPLDCEAVNKKGSRALAWTVVMGLLWSLAVLLTMTTPACAQPALNPDNGHYYELVIVDPGMAWCDARDAAAAMTYMGMPGHLATVTSEAEHKFLKASFTELTNDDGPRVWLGGTDEVQEDDWRWITGEPWHYTNWDLDCGEPNGGGEENCLEYKNRRAGDPKWNDESCDSELEAYLVEYGPTPPESVPTITPPGIMLMVGLLAVAGSVMLRRRE